MSEWMRIKIAKAKDKSHLWVLAPKASFPCQVKTQCGRWAVAYSTWLEAAPDAPRCKVCERTEGKAG